MKKILFLALLSMLATMPQTASALQRCGTRPPQFRNEIRNGTFIEYQSIVDRHPELLRGCWAKRNPYRTPVRYYFSYDGILKVNLRTGRTEFFCSSSFAKRASRTFWHLRGDDIRWGYHKKPRYRVREHQTWNRDYHSPHWRVEINW